MPAARLPVVRAAVAQGYRSPDGAPALLYECHAVGGAGPLAAG
jgi:hypothetical protein